ncbi:MAG TPA: MFS transporter [Bacteroidales bacterium]|nr:MFS transporter [Bacteroidales bacterium]
MNKIKGNIRFAILGLLFFATTINYIDRQVIGILKPYIEIDLGWSEFDYGLIVSVFQLAYAAGMLLTGVLLDKFGTRLGYTVAIAVWSIAGMLHAAARSAMSFAAARLFLGLGESANFPAAIKTVAEWFPQKERAHATGLFNSGSSIGAIAAPVIVTGIAVTMGWQWAFIITGGLGFLWIICWLLFYFPVAKHPRLSREEKDHILQDSNGIENSDDVKWTDLFRYRQTYALCATRFISDWVWWFFLFWTPDFLHKMHGVNIKEAVIPLIVIYGVASFGGIGGGWISSYLINKGRSVDYARKMAVLISALVVLPIVIVPQIKSLWLTVILIAVGCAGHCGWASNMFTMISDIYPKKAVGSMTGLAGFAAAIGGALAASFVGLILDTTGSYFLIFLIASSVYILNWIIIKLFIPEIRPII